MNSVTAEQLAKALGLQAHVEGGYFRRTYRADHRPLIPTEMGERFLVTSIYYLLTSQAPIGHFHLNRSDILHFYHLGDPIRYWILHPNGQLDRVVMGSDVINGQQLQLMVKGGCWKASELLPGDCGYGLISEAVSPGFDFSDMTLGSQETLSALFPQHAECISRLTKK